MDCKNIFIPVPAMFYLEDDELATALWDIEDREETGDEGFISCKGN